MFDELNHKTNLIYPANMQFLRPFDYEEGLMEMVDDFAVEEQKCNTVNEIPMKYVLIKDFSLVMVLGQYKTNGTYTVLLKAKKSEQNNN